MRCALAQQSYTWVFLISLCLHTSRNSLCCVVQDSDYYPQVAFKNNVDVPSLGWDFTTGQLNARQIGQVVSGFYIRSISVSIRWPLNIVCFGYSPRASACNHQPSPLTGGPLQDAQVPRRNYLGMVCNPTCETRYKDYRDIKVPSLPPSKGTY